MLPFPIAFPKFVSWKNVVLSPATPAFRLSEADISDGLRPIVTYRTTEDEEDGELIAPLLCGCPKTGDGMELRDISRARDMKSRTESFETSLPVKINKIAL